MSPLRPTVVHAAVIAALLVALFVGYFTSGTVVVENDRVGTTTSSGLAALPPVSLPSVMLPSLTSTTSVATTSPVAAKAKPPVKAVANATTTAPVTTTTTTVTAAPTGNLATASTDIRSALVNIICESPQGIGLQSISGSGVIIDPRGIILTNAHIGQYFLLHNLGVRCVIRTGSPAASAYYAEPAFVSPAWLSANSTALTEAQPTGTGEHDIAILVITGSANGAPLPSSYSYVPLGENAPTLEEPVVIGSYAAQFLQTSQIENSLYPTIVYGAIQSLYTFTTNTVDVVSLGGSAAAQEGSSGGGVVDANGTLEATITTSTTAGSTADRELDAITDYYVRSDYAAETGLALSTLLTEKPSDMVANFAPQIPSLEAIITADLPNQ
jgi:hypothetical protein